MTAAGLSVSVTALGCPFIVTAAGSSVSVGCPVTVSHSGLCSHCGLSSHCGFVQELCTTKRTSVERLYSTMIKLRQVSNGSNDGSTGSGSTGGGTLVW